MSNQSLSYVRPALKQQRVVITGVGAVTPLGLSATETWKNCVNGVSGIAPITKFDTTGFATRFAGEVRGLNPDLYIQKKEQKKMDSFIHYAIAATHMALEMSGLNASNIPSERAGCLIGVGMGGLPSIEEQIKKFSEKGPDRISPFFIPMVISNLAAGHISIMYNLKGPNYCVTSACASGAHSIGEAVESIRNGTCDVMVAGGSESTVCAMAVGGFSAMHALSERNDNPTKASRPYDKDRDGFVMSEGSGIVILESLEFALKRGAQIICEVTGYGLSSDAFHMTNPAPEGAGAARAMQMALKDSRLNPEQIDYVNTHGTSTPIGDLIETQAIKNIFGAHAATLTKSTDKSLWVSSTKSMTGHSLGAAGAIESVICALAIKDGTVPPTINLENPSPECDLDYVAGTARSRKLKHVLNNSFGFGGTNACLILSSLES